MRCTRVFDDGDFAADYMVWLATQGFTEGCDLTHYCPKEALSRAGFLKILNRPLRPDSGRWRVYRLHGFFEKITKNSKE